MAKIVTKKRIYELARELNMTNRVLLEQLREWEFDIKSHMSSLDEETEALIKDKLMGPKDDDVEITRVKPTVIRKRKKVVEPKAVKAEPVPAPEPQPEEVRVAEAPEDEVPEKKEAPAKDVPSTESPKEEAESPKPSVEPEVPGEKTKVVKLIQPAAPVESVEPGPPDKPEVTPPAEHKPPADPEPEKKRAASKKGKSAKKAKKETPAKIIKLPVASVEKPVEVEEEEQEEKVAEPKAKIEKIPLPPEIIPESEEESADLTEKDKKKQLKRKGGDPLKDKKFSKKKISFISRS